jgi:hypothetical protein
MKNISTMSRFETRLILDLELLALAAMGGRARLCAK